MMIGRTPEIATIAEQIGDDNDGLDHIRYWNTIILFHSPTVAVGSANFTWPLMPRFMHGLGPQLVGCQYYATRE